jgi:hypothetical protein
MSIAFEIVFDPELHSARAHGRGQAEGLVAGST